MTNRTLFPILCLSLAVNLSFGGLYAFAKWADGPKRGLKDFPEKDREVVHSSQPGAPSCILDELRLKSKQKVQFEALRKTLWQKRSRYFATLAKLRRRIGETIAQGRGPATPAQEKQLQELLDHMCKKQSAFRLVVIHHLFDVKGLLDEEQKKHFARLLKTKIFRGMSRVKSDGGKP